MILVRSKLSIRIIEKKEVRKVEEGSSSIEPGGQDKLRSISEKLEVADRIGRENVIELPVCPFSETNLI